MSLRTASDYVFEDVSAIEITGNFLPERQDSVLRGEDIALIREYAAETESIMGFSNPFANEEKVHKIRDLSYLLYWWNNQRSPTRTVFPVSRWPSNYESGWTKISSEWNRVQKRNDLEDLMAANRIRTGALAVPTGGDVLSKSAISNLVTSIVPYFGNDNYFAVRAGRDVGFANFDLVDETGYSRHYEQYPDDSTALPWGLGTPRCCIRWENYSNGTLRWHKTATNLRVYPDRMPQDINKSHLMSYSCDIAVAAVKSVGDYGPTQQNCCIFCWRTSTNNEIGEFLDVRTIPYQSLLDQVPDPTASGSIRENCVFICGIWNPVSRWRLNAAR